VRNTLETLVAKGCIERHKQNRTVMYTVTGPAEEATSDPQSTAVDDD
jgi:predicted transcriptional regulator